METRPGCTAGLPFSGHTVNRQTAQPGFFITFEGIDKSGKSTQLELLAQRLREDGHEVVLTHEPGGTPLGREIRRLALDPTPVVAVHPMAEMFLFAADRAQHIAEVIRPALTQGKTVISDRFVDSTIAYQGYGRERDTAQLQAVQAIATGGLKPDLTVLVDLDVATSRKRYGDEGFDRLERETDAFFERVRSGFLALGEAEPDRIFRVDGRRPPAELLACIHAETCRRMTACSLRKTGNVQGAGASL